MTYEEEVAIAAGRLHEAAAKMHEGISLYLRAGQRLNEIIMKEKKKEKETNE